MPNTTIELGECAPELFIDITKIQADAMVLLESLTLRMNSEATMSVVRYGGLGL